MDRASPQIPYVSTDQPQTGIQINDATLMSLLSNDHFIGIIFQVNDKLFVYKTLLHWFYCEEFH